MRHRLFAHAGLPIVAGFRININVRDMGGLPYTITTGRDDNGDAVINDRPDDVGRNSARAAGQTTMDLRLSWSKGLGKRNPDGGGEPGIQVIRGGPGGRGGFMGGDRVSTGDSRLVLELFADASNVLNAVNYTRYSGVITSPLVGQPLAAQAPRRIDLGMRVGF
jgi:hypothetical protein